MLVLTRRPGESIVIGDGIKLTIVSIGPGRVKVGIEAPPTVRIDRQEVHSRIQQEQSTDVLAAVSATASGVGEPNTMVSSSSETGIYHNRIAEQLPANPPPASGNPAGNGISKFRAPRKSR